MVWDLDEGFARVDGAFEWTVGEEAAWSVSVFDLFGDSFDELERVASVEEVVEEVDDCFFVDV